MVKLLLLLILGGLCLLAWKTFAGGVRRPGVRARTAATATSEPVEPAPASMAEEAMLRCNHCGVHFPASEVQVRDGLPFCSPGHRDAKPGR